MAEENTEAENVETENKTADLSDIIQEGLCGTLQDLLAKDAKLKEITRVVDRDIDKIEFIKIDSEFAFEKITTIFSFYVPAASASIIFNTMMGSTDYDIATTIDDDTSDAMGEVISNISGGLVTAINAENLKELGTTKFNIPHKDILNGSDVESRENIFKFSVNLEDQKINLLIEFKDDFVKYISEISKSIETEYPEEPEEDIKEEEKKEEPKKEQEETPKEEKEEPQEEEVNPKDKKLKLLVMIIGGLLALTLITGVVMYIMGAFDQEPMPQVQESNVTKETEDKVSVVKYTTLKKVDFKITDINVKRLNARLEVLTKYEILTQEELEAQALEEKNRLYNLTKEKKLLEFAKKNKEEPISIKTEKKEDIQSNKNKDSKTDIANISKKDINQTININMIDQTIKEVPNNNEKIISNSNNITSQEPQVNDDKKLKFVLSSSLRYKLFKELITQTQTKQARISICNNEDGRTTIFIGPFENNQIQTKMQTLIKNEDSTIQTIIRNMTETEFDKRCNF